MSFGGSSSTQSTSSPWASSLGAIGNQQWRIAKPLLQQMGSQFLEALRTGGINSFIPWISRAMDTVRRSSSQGIENLRQNEARTGQAGSTFGQQAITSAQTQAGEEANNTPEQMIMQWIQQAPGFAGNLAARATGSLSSAASFDNTVKQTSQPGFWDLFSQGLQSGGMIGAAAI